MRTENPPHEAIKQRLGQPGVFHLGDERPHEGSHHVLDRHRLTGPFALGSLQPRQTLLIDRHQVAGHHHLHQCVATAKIVIHRRHIASGRLCDVAHRHHVKAVLRKQLLGRFDQAQLRTLLWNKRSIHRLPQPVPIPPPLSNK